MSISINLLRKKERKIFLLINNKNFFDLNNQIKQDIEILKKLIKII